MISELIYRLDHGDWIDTGLFLGMSYAFGHVLGALVGWIMNRDLY